MKSRHGLIELVAHFRTAGRFEVNGSHSDRLIRCVIMLWGAVNPRSGEQQ
jgi:hypothetical protein